MEFNFCLIATKSYLPQVRAVIHSVRQMHPCNVYVFFTDLKKKDIPKDDSFFLVTEPELNNFGTFSGSRKKYRWRKDAYRWALKPLLMRYLLEKKALSSVIYLDTDLYFFGDYQFLFNKLERSAFLLCPHWRIMDPEKSKEWFFANFRDGVYNAGMVGASKKGRQILQWWEEACHFRCERNVAKGLFVDQKYLDIVPAAFEGVEIVRHRGCNVAYWNQFENSRSLVQDDLRINDQWPIVFVHFTRKLIQAIEKGKDPLLRPLLKEYQLVLKRFQ